MISACGTGPEFPQLAAQLRPRVPDFADVGKRVPECLLYRCVERRNPPVQLHDLENLDADKRTGQADDEDCRRSPSRPSSHRPFFPRIFYITLAHFSHWNIKWVTIIGWFSYVLISFLIYFNFYSFFLFHYAINQLKSLDNRLSNGTVVILPKEQ